MEDDVSEFSGFTSSTAQYFARPPPSRIHLTPREMEDDLDLEEAFIDAEIYSARERRMTDSHQRKQQGFPPGGGRSSPSPMAASSGGGGGRPSPFIVVAVISKGGPPIVPGIGGPPPPLSPLGVRGMPGECGDGPLLYIPPPPGPIFTVCRPRFGDIPDGIIPPPPGYGFCALATFPGSFCRMKSTGLPGPVGG